MKATVDANIFISALLKKGLTRSLWFAFEIELYAPIFILDEFQKHETTLLRKFGGSSEDFTRLAGLLLSYVTLVADKELKPYVPAASSLITDQKDIMYLACALKEDTVLWSEDKGFKRQKRVKTLTTTEMKEEFGTF